MYQDAAHASPDPPPGVIFSPRSVLEGPRAWPTPKNHLETPGKSAPLLLIAMRRDSPESAT
eukprot:8081559-Pyramimonas_sp.AAC.1